MSGSPRDRPPQLRGDWKLIAPYLADALGAPREDYSADGAAWRYFPFDHALSRAYRWSEDGLASLSDREQRLCFALSSWNGRDPILKERIFSLSGRAITARTRRAIGGLSTRRRPTPCRDSAIAIRKRNFPTSAYGRRTRSAHASSRNSSFSTAPRLTGIDTGKSRRNAPKAATDDVY
jgi:hypothetical protein